MTVERRDGNHKSDFSEWFRGNPRLKSMGDIGLSITDFDWIVHNFGVRTQHGMYREFHNMMCIEEKRYGRELDEAQRDTISIFQQITMLARQPDEPKNYRVFSPYAKKNIWVRFYGYHLLEFSGCGPLDSRTIRWDCKQIDIPTLEQVMRFELSPITLKPRTERSHHGGKPQKTLDLYY